MIIKLKVYRDCTDLHIHMQKHFCTHPRTPCLSGQACSCSFGVEVKKSCGFRQDGAARPKPWRLQSCPPSLQTCTITSQAARKTRFIGQKCRAVALLPTYIYTHTHNRKEKRGENTCNCNGDGDKIDWRKRLEITRI